MKVLHYSLGFPPFRSGGLVKFCIDLMTVQQENGIEVAMIWPGKIVNDRCKSYIIKKKDKLTKFSSYELVNPMPVPLDEGVLDVELFVKSKTIEEYEKILNKINPDVIHFHTLMGLPLEFVLAAKRKKIKTIFTAHDYYGICPKVTLFYNNSVCCNAEECQNCFDCNKTALSYTKIKLLQSNLYRSLKNNRIFKELRKRHRTEFFKQTENISNEFKNKNMAQYLKLRAYYYKILNNINLIHFNSSLTEKIYSKYFKFNNTTMINISNLNISDNRKIKEYKNDIITFTYLASTKPYKGYFLLREVLKEIWDEGNRDFVLNTYDDLNFDNQYPFIKCNKRFKSEELSNIFDNTDLLIAPSIWYETYGYTVLEAISYGVPVIISDNVGAKDIVSNAGIIVKSNDKQSLKDAIKKVLNNRACLKELNKETFLCRIPKMQEMLNILEENCE